MVNVLDLMPGEAVRENYRRQGAARAIERVTLQIENRICFDNLEGRGCDHAVCYNNRDLIALIRGAK